LVKLQIEEESRKLCSQDKKECLRGAALVLRELGYEVQESESGVIRVKELKVIREVSIEGGVEELPALERTVRLLTEGKPLWKVNLESISQLIKIKLRLVGYPNAQVLTELKRRECGYGLIIKIDKGYWLFIERVEVEAPKDFERLIKEHFGKLEGKRLNFTQLRQIKEELLAELIKMGYYNAKLTTRVVPEEAWEGSVRKAVLKVKLEAGKRYEIVFKGAKGFKREELLSLLTFDEARSVDEFELENSRRNLERFFKDRGYPFARVSVRLEEEGSEARVIFEVELGESVVVKEVLFEGDSLEEELISSLKEELEGKPYSERRVKRASKRLKEELRKRGYLDARVFTEVKRSGELIFKVKKGAVYLLVAVAVEPEFNKCSEVLKLNLPAPLTPDLRKELPIKLKECYADSGYPEASVESEEEVVRAGKEKKEIVLKLKVKKGKFYRFGFIIVRGLKRIKLDRVKELLTVKPGEPYSQEKLLEQHSLLLESGLFTSVFNDEVKGEKFVNEIFRLEEGMLLRLKGFVGYGSDYGYVLNLSSFATSPLGMGAKYFAFVNYRQKEGYNAVVRALKPAYPFRRYSTSISFVKKEQLYESFKSDKLLYSITLHRKASKRFEQDFSYTVSRSELSDTSIKTSRSTYERKVSLISRYDRRDSFSNPRSGFAVRGEASLAGLFLGGEASYYLLDGRFNYLKELSPKDVVSLRFGLGIIKALEGKEVPLEDRFFLGGAESVRGYKYGTISPQDESGNYVGGRAYGLAGLELRHLLKDRIEGALFFDAGRVFETPSDFKLSDWYSSIGVGIRYLTPVGPLRIDYGYKLKKVPSQGRGRFHISFGFPF